MNLNNPDHLSKYMDAYRSLERSLSTTIRIDHAQVDFITVNRLIGIRNNGGCSIVAELDTVLRFFLTENEFQKHVINQQPIEDEN